MSSFFTLPGSAAAKKRKRSGTAVASDRSKKPRASDAESRPARPSRKRPADEEISSEEEEEEGADEVAAEASGSEEDEEFEGETAVEKRLRLAQQYLDNLREEVDEGGFDAADIDRDNIAHRLKQDVAEEKGRIYRFLSSSYNFSSATSTLFRADNRPTTDIAVCSPYVYTVTKDRYLVKWELPAYPPPLTTRNFTPARKPRKVKYARGPKAPDRQQTGHIGEILCVAASADGKFVVTGGKDKRLIVWDAATLEVLKVFEKHRDAVTSIVFRRGTNQLYSASSDRTVNLWSIDDMAYVETLYGHQDTVIGIAALAEERCVTVGARDRTARLWKIVDETQLVFRGNSSVGSDKPRRFNKDGSDRYEEGSMDRIVMVDEEHFVTGSDNGDICFWSMNKKKPLFTLPTAHGLDPPPPPERSTAEQDPGTEPLCPPKPRYITALAAIPYSDLVFSGSWDGTVRVWRVVDKKRLESAGCLGQEGAVRGVVNALDVFERGEKGKEDGIVVLAGTGTEVKGGRWVTVAGRNGGYVLEVAKAREEAMHRENAPEEVES